MGNKSIIFSGTFLSINDKPVNNDIFKDILPEGNFTTVADKKVHSYSFSYVENYLKITFGDGSAMPRNPQVIDITTNESTPNPRQSNQVEPRETFGLIDFNTSFLWLSNSRKKNSLIDFLKDNFKNSIIVSKDIYDEQKFIETIKKLDLIKVSAVPDLFSESHILTECLSEEINGYEATIASLQFQYQEKLIGTNLLEKIKSIFRNRTNFNGIVISGRDANNLGMLFNTDGFSRKIEFNAIIDENEMFLTDDVFNKLITKIKDENH